MRRPAPLGPDDLLGRDAVDDLAALQAPEGRPGGHAEPRRETRVEAPGPRLLHEGPAEGRAAVAGGEGLHGVAVEGDVVARLELGDRELVAEPAREPADDREQVARAGRPEEVQRRSRSRRSKDLSMPGRPSQWSRWKWVRKIAETSGSPTERSELALRALAAVEEQLVAPAADQQRREARGARSARSRAVPAKNSERSIRPEEGRAERYRRAPRPAAPVAQWIERSPPEREVAGSNPAGRVG